MLILTRRVGETIVIGDDIIVTVLGIKGNQVRVGINAPKDVSVHREEIYQRIKQEQASPSEKTETVTPPPPAAPSEPGNGTNGSGTTVSVKRKREPRIDKTEVSKV